jgi:dihydroxy-acid dehydratase
MASAAEVLGMTVPGSSSFPAEYPEKLQECDSIGEVMKNLLEKDIKPRDIMTRKAFENAMVRPVPCFAKGKLPAKTWIVRQVLTMVLGGSTNAVLHLIAIAHSVGITLTVDDFQAVSDRTPLLADLRPSGKYLMEDIFKIGGIPSTFFVCFALNRVKERRSLISSLPLSVHRRAQISSRKETYRWKRNDGHWQDARRKS